MKKIITIALAASAMIAAVPASATEFTFDLRNDGIGTPAVAWGNSFKYKATSGGETIDVMVSAWSRELNGSIKQAAVASWDPNGLGIFQQNESQLGTMHQIDNVNGWEFLSFQFSKAVTLASGVLDAYNLPEVDGNGVPVKDRFGRVVYRNYIDNDAFLGWSNSAVSWDSALGLQNSNQAAVFGALSGSTNTNGSGASAQTFNLSGATGNTWLIGASIGGPDGLNDAFKLAGLTVRTAAAGGVVSPVPEPATWAMMLVGFGMVGAAARYRRRKTTAVFA